MIIYCDKRQGVELQHLQIQAQVVERITLDPDCLNLDARFTSA